MSGSECNKPVQTQFLLELRMSILRRRCSFGVFIARCWFPVDNTDMLRWSCRRRGWRGEHVSVCVCVLLKNQFISSFGDNSNVTYIPLLKRSSSYILRVVSFFFFFFLHFQSISVHFGRHFLARPPPYESDHFFCVHIQQRCLINHGREWQEETLAEVESCMRRRELPDPRRGVGTF